MLIIVALLFVGRIIMIMAMLKMAAIVTLFGRIIMAAMWKMVIMVIRLKIQNSKME